jgi:DNA polymerase III delta prime subunit
MLGIVRPTNDIAVHVGGANAGKRLRRNMIMKSTRVIFVMSVNSATARPVRKWSREKSV